MFDDADALPLERSDIKTVLAASDLDWSEVDPSILGTLFERGLDPDKRTQLGAHYTDRDKIMLLVDPVVIRPLLAEWVVEKTEIAAELERAEAAKASATRTKRRREAERRYRAFLNRLRGFTVLDPACGSGNFLYLALQALKDGVFHPAPTGLAPWLCILKTAYRAPPRFCLYHRNRPLWLQASASKTP